MGRGAVPCCTVGHAPSIHTGTIVRGHTDTLPGWTPSRWLGWACSGWSTCCGGRGWGHGCWPWWRWRLCRGEGRRRSTPVEIILDEVHQGVLPLPTLGAGEIVKVQCPEHGATKTLGFDHGVDLVLQALKN